MNMPTTMKKNAAIRLSENSARRSRRGRIGAGPDDASRPTPEREPVTHGLLLRVAKASSPSAPRASASAAG